MKPKRQSVIQLVLVLLVVLATLCSWPAVSGSLKGAAEKLIDQRLQTDNMFKTAGSTPPTLTASKTSSLTDCGSKWYQRLGLQFLEVSQATVVGFSFNTACQAHDACYGDCRTGKPESDKKLLCDKKLLEDAEGVCESAWNRAICISYAQIFFQAVSKKGDTPFKQARANCPATVGLPAPSNEDIRSIDFQREAPTSGAYDGKILSLSRCDLSEGDRRTCHDLTIKLSSGKVIQASIWGLGAVQIYNNRGGVIYKVNPSDSSADMRIKFDSAIRNLLKKGANVWVNISCGGDSGCYISIIRLK